MDITTPTLPTIHLNGTGADTLEREYRAVRHAIAAAADALVAATCNQRDFYPQEPGAWERARAERAEALLMLDQVSHYAEHWEERAAEHRRAASQPAMFPTVQDALKACELAGYEPRQDVSGYGEDRFYVWLPGTDSPAATCYWGEQQFMRWANAHFRRRSAAAVADAEPQP